MTVGIVRDRILNLFSPGETATIWGSARFGPVVCFETGEKPSGNEDVRNEQTLFFV